MMRNQKPFNLRIPLVVWNGILSVFSILGFIRFSEVEILTVLTN